MCAPLRLADLQPATAPVPGTLTTVYDNFFRASQIGVNGSNIAYTYDADGLLTGAGNMTLARDPGNGLVTGTALGQIATTQSYDSFGRVSGFTASQGATVLYSEQYQRDNRLKGSCSHCFSTRLISTLKPPHVRPAQNS